ncbi:MAG: hypothetical protein KGJ84_00180 [Elusimicrobia bacterium]|nr:hypothetical protein [Elusimicrobiota bacterium]
MSHSLLFALALLPTAPGFAQDGSSTSRPASGIEKATPRPSYPLLERTFKAGLTPDQQRALGGRAALAQMVATMTLEQKTHVRQQLDAARAEAATSEALKEIAQGYLLLDERGAEGGQNIVAVGARLRELEPKKPDGYTIMAEGHYRNGDYPAAAEQARTAWEMSGHTDKAALTILKMSEGRTSAAPSSGQAPTTVAAPDGVTVAGADFTIPENNDISPQALAFIHQAAAARRKGDMTTTWNDVQAAMNADPTSTEVQKLYAFAKEDRLKYTETKDYLRRSREAMDAGRGEEAVAWAQKAADRSGDPTVRKIVDLAKRESAKLAQAPAGQEAPKDGMPLWPIGAGLGLTATAYGIYRSKQTWASEDGLDPEPEVSPEQTRGNYLKSAALAGTAFVALAAWEFGPGAFAAARAFFSAVGPAAPAAQLATAGAGVSANGGGAVILDHAVVAAGAKAMDTTAVLIGGAAVASDHYTFATGRSPTQVSGDGGGDHPNGLYEESPKHGATARGGPQGKISAAPQNGQDVLDKAINVKPTSTQKVGIDYANDEYVVFREHLPGRYHGYVSTWEELAVEARNALIKAGRATARGRIIKL